MTTERAQVFAAIRAESDTIAEHYENREYARALRDMQVLRERGLEPLHMAVNLSFRQFQDSQLLPTLTRLIDERAIVNAMVGLLATGGSTNHTIHLVAMARAAGQLPAGGAILGRAAGAVARDAGARHHAGSATSSSRWLCGR